MVIEILQAGTGDSIWVSHNKKNIVIDGGKSTAAIRAKYSKMPQDEIIDLLVVTHIDSDHIAGIIALVKHMKEIGETHRLKQVWFNFPKKEETDEYSVGEGNELTSLLLEIDGLFWNNNTSELLGSTIEFGDIKLHVLAPDHDVAYENKPKEPDELGVRSDDWYIDLRTLIDNVDDDDIDEGGTNSQSIIILAECEGKKLLLPGDSTPKKLCDALQSYNKTNIEILEIEQSQGLKIRITGYQRTKFVQGIPIQRLGMLYPLLQMYRRHSFYYQLATVALKICSVMSFTIRLINSSCTSVSSLEES